MKRLLWCLCLCSLGSTLVTGCGDDESSGGSEDGGVQQDLDEVNNRIDDAEDRLDELTGNIDDVGDDLADLEDRFADAGAQLDERLDALEDPPILSCSEYELCIPRGVMEVTEGIGDIISVVCEHEMDCCSEAELNLKFGPGITNTEQCVALFTDMIENGFSPDFYDAYLTPSVVYQVIGVVQALNDPRVRVEIDPDGVQECVDALEIECPEITEPGPAPDPECYAATEPEDDPCSLDNLLNGLQEEGELCGAYSYGEGEDIPECQDGFYCSFGGFLVKEQSAQGICAKLPEDGDSCQDDFDCDPFGVNSYYRYGPLVTNLYCNIENAECAPLGDVGDPCEFIDDSFTIVDESNLYPTDPSATSRDCKNGLTCDPTSNECVANCSAGRLCNPFGDPFFTCGEGRVCNVTEVPDLYESWTLGICAAALDVGDTCTLGSECDSGTCQDDCNVDTGLCACSEVLEIGDECDTPGPDPLCRTGWCNADGECAAQCNCDDSVQDGSCDPSVEGPAKVACDDGFYCDMYNYIPNTSMFACEPVIANGTACDTTLIGSIHASCNSGFCDPMNTQCAAKVAADAACPSNLDEQCRNTQYCNNMQFCRTYRNEGQSCDLTDESGLECAEGLACVDGDSSDTCQALAAPGEACNDLAQDEPPCDDREDDSITCVDIDGAGGNTEFECYSPNGGYADTVDCTVIIEGLPYFMDSFCASGWCRPEAAEGAEFGTCEQPLQEGDECDTANATKNRCGEGLYCDHPRTSTEGTCKEQSGPGGPCNPFFDSGDCRFGGSCIFTKDQFLCDSDSIDYGNEIFCGGG